MSKEKLQIDLIKDGQRPADGTVLEESTTWEVKNKINISCNGRVWEYDLSTCFIVRPPSQTDVEPTLNIVGSYISRVPIPTPEKVILDSKKP